MLIVCETCVCLLCFVCDSACVCALCCLWVVDACLWVVCCFGRFLYKCWLMPACVSVCVLCLWCFVGVFGECVFALLVECLLLLFLLLLIVLLSCVSWCVLHLGACVVLCGCVVSFCFGCVDC